MPNTDHATDATGITAFIFSEHEISPDIYDSIHRLHNNGDLQVLDVCEFKVVDNGKIKFERAMTLPLIGESDGLFLEAFVGLLFFHAPHNNSVEKALHEIHVDTRFMEELKERAVPGASVLFLHTSKVLEADVVGTIAGSGSHAVAMPLPDSQQTKLNLLFHGKQLQDVNSTSASMH